MPKPTTNLATPRSSSRNEVMESALPAERHGRRVPHLHDSSIVVKVGTPSVPTNQPNAPDSQSGFTLIELMVVMIIIATLAAIAVPLYSHHLRVAKEAVLRSDLQVIRGAIDSYTVDKQKSPQAGDDLVTAGYLKTMPVDPITHSATTWTFDRSDTYSSVDQTETGINDVHSGSGLASTDGTSYSTW